MKKLVFLVIIILLGACNPKYREEVYVIEKKSEYPETYFLIKTLPKSILQDTLYTVININNYHYMDHELWDQMYFSYEEKDTIKLSVKRDKFWKKLEINE